MRKVMTTTSALAVAIFVPQYAAAQVAAAPQTEGSATAAANESANGLGDIIVTARRREESVQAVPLSIQAFSAQKLAVSGVTRPSDLTAITPSLTVSATGGGGSALPVFSLRGIAITEVTVTQDPTVGVYVNDVYQARPIGVNQSLLDIENVQVLIGPQGTLFGRNTPAGAISFTTKRPTDKFEGEVGTTLGSLHRADFHAIVNVPLTDSLMIRLAGQRSRRDGYTYDITTGNNLDDENNYSFRGSVLYTSGNFENLTVADYFKSHENGSAAIVTAVVPTVGTPPAYAANIAQLYPGALADLAAQQARGPRVVRYTAAGPGKSYFARAEAYGVSNTTTLHLNDSLLVKNIFGYRHTESFLPNDTDGLPDPILVQYLGGNGRQFSNETQLQYSSRDVNAIVGFFYFHERSQELDGGDLFLESPVAGAITGNPNAFAVRDNVTDTTATNISKAIFAQVSYKPSFLEGLSLTLGGRYTWDTREGVYRPTVAGNCALSGVTLTNNICEHAVKVNFSKPTYNVSLDYQITSNKLVYVAHRRGYRSGGFDPRASSAAQFVPFQPETVNDVEFGFKGDWGLGGDAKLRTNIAVYETWYSNIQRGTVQLDPITGAPSTVVRNAAKAKVKGLEFNAVLTPVRGVTLSGYLGYVDAKQTSFAFTATNASQTGAMCGKTVITGPGSYACSDVPFGGVAKYTYGFAGSVTALDSPEAGQIILSANYAYRSAYTGANDLPFITGYVGAQNLLNMALDWNNIGQTGLSAEAWMRNALDKTYSYGTLSIQTSLGEAINYYAPPRTYGLTLKYNW